MRPLSFTVKGTLCLPSAKRTLGDPSFAEPRHIRLEQLAKARRGGWAISLDALLYPTQMLVANQTTFQQASRLWVSQCLIVSSLKASTYRSAQLAPCSAESPFRAFLVPARLGLVTGADLNRAKYSSDFQIYLGEQAGSRSALGEGN